MEKQPSPSPGGHPGGWGRAAVLTGLLAGTLDIAAACTQYVLLTHKSPVNVLDFIASALFGKEAFAGGIGMALTGLAAHYLIAILFAMFFYWLCPRLPWFLQRPVLAGVFYGLAVWLLMNLLVLPNSRVAVQPLQPVPSAIGLGILILCIGLPIAIRAARYYTRRV